MIEDSDLESMLSTGTWTTQRAKSPRPLNNHPPPPRANQSAKLNHLDAADDLKVPRSLPDLSHRRPARPPPPPPSVEDEEASVARELNGSVTSSSDEEPKHKGTVEQNPILLPVPEFNAERRFVLVAPLEAAGGDVAPDAAPHKPDASPNKTASYPANTKVPLDAATTTTPPPPPPGLRIRRSRTDLPRIETDVNSPSSQPRPAPHAHRSRSATCVDQRHQDEARDYFSPHPESAHLAADGGFLSPATRHSTKGRDRAYWSFDPPSHHGSGAGSRDQSPGQRPRPADRKSTQHGRRPSRSPSGHRRLHSDADLPRRAAERHSSYSRDEAHGRSRRGQPPSPPHDRRQSPPPRLARREPSPARSHTGSPRSHTKRSSYHGRSSPPKDPADLSCSSDDHREASKAPHPRRHRRKSMVIQEGRRSALLLSPVGPPRPAPVSSKTKSRLSSPLPSPKVSDEMLYSSSCKPQPDPRSSAPHFHVPKARRRHETERPVSPLSSSGSSSPRSRSGWGPDDRASEMGRPRAPSRTPSTRSTARPCKPVNTPLSTTPPPMAIPPDDRRKRQALPPSPTWSRQGSLETIALPPPPPPPDWPPVLSPHTHNHHCQRVPLTPRHSGTNLGQPAASVVSYRRYSEDVNAGALPGLPDCPRQRPRAGLEDWYTLPKHDNFNVCPSCYDQVFLYTEFRDDLVPPHPARDLSREVACDLGTSPWYRIAWLMTRKYRRPDLRLLQGIADVSARHKVPCYGPAKVTRNWYSVIDPAARRCIPDFTVCSPCAEAVQVLFPSLTGVFVPQDRQAEPRPGTCSLHFAPSRNRFLLYFDVLEGTHDRAVAHQSAPNIQHLADGIRKWSEIEECPGEMMPLRNEPWYIPSSVPDLTVCEECYTEVVVPELVADVEAMASGGAGGAGTHGNSQGLPVANGVVRNFYQQPQVIKSPTVCQMASPRMRELFRKACRREDGIEYLDSKVRERLAPSR